MEKDATKRQGSIAWCDLIKTKKFITVMGFTGIINIWGLAQ